MADEEGEEGEEGSGALAPKAGCHCKTKCSIDSLNTEIPEYVSKTPLTSPSRTGSCESLNIPKKENTAVGVKRKKGDALVNTSIVGNRTLRHKILKKGGGFTQMERIGIRRACCY